MDITLIKTFIEVAAAGSFAGAAERLFVTQSAVSLRVQRLETELGRTLFKRSKAGAEMTSAGAEFERFAYGLIKLWEESKQRVAIPEGFSKSISIGAQYSLWPRMGFRWLDTMRAEMPELSVRAEFGDPATLTRHLIEGVVQSALMYTPQLRPGFSIEKVMDDELVMVASWPDPDINDLADRYLFVDWGPEFVHAHALHLPDLTNPGLVFALGALSADYVLAREVAAYVPARFAQDLIGESRLHLVADAPRFPFPVFHVWRDDLDDEVSAVARNSLSRIVRGLEMQQMEVIETLQQISEGDEVPILGDSLPGDNGISGEEQ